MAGQAEKRVEDMRKGQAEMSQQYVSSIIFKCESNLVNSLVMGDTAHAQILKRLLCEAEAHLEQQGRKEAVIKESVGMLCDELTGEYNDIKTIVDIAPDLFSKWNIPLSNTAMNVVNEIFEKQHGEEEKREKEKQLSTFVFDENKVLRRKIFPFFKIDDNVGGFGVFLPKERDMYTDKGKLIGKEQVLVPVTITSDRKLHEIGKDFEKRTRINFDVLPNESNYVRRWSLKSIKEYLDDEAPQIQGLKLFNKICDTYNKFLYFSNDAWYAVHALWDLGTYFFLLAKHYPLMEIRGLRGTAKSKIMTVSRLFTFNATEEMTNPSEATLFRETHDKRPTKYIDEAERLYMVVKGKLEADPRAELINSGYKYSGTVPRQEKIGHNFKTVYYSTYSPAMIASINGLYGATEDRAIIHTTVKPLKGDDRGMLDPDESDSIYQQTRDDCYIFALQNWKAIESKYEAFNKPTGLKNRDLTLWKLMLVLADHIDTKLYDEVLAFAQILTKVKNVDGVPEGSVEFKILQTLHALVHQGHNPVLVRDIIDRFPGPEDRIPANRTIARHLDKLGFMECKGHFELGTGYAIPKEMSDNIIGNICPSILSSAASVSSGLNRFTEEKPNIKEEEVPENNLKFADENPEHTEDTEHSEDISATRGTKRAFPMEVLSYISEQLGNGQTNIPIEDITAEFHKKGATEISVDEALAFLKQRGEIYEPRRGVITKI